MAYANWQCWLYGHDWRHPGEHEVVVAADCSPCYPMQCQRCANVQLLDREGNSWSLEDEDGPSIHEEALAFDTTDRRD